MNDCINASWISLIEVCQLAAMEQPAVAAGALLTIAALMGPGDVCYNLINEAVAALRIKDFAKAISTLCAVTSLLAGECDEENQFLLDKRFDQGQ